MKSVMNQNENLLLINHTFNKKMQSKFILTFFTAKVEKSIIIFVTILISV